MTRIIATLAMILSLAYYTLILAMIWITSFAGDHTDLRETFDLPNQDTDPALWVVIIGIACSALTLFSLALAYWSLHKILKGGRGQDFRRLGKNMRHSAFGLLGFWLGYNLLSALIPWLFSFTIPRPTDYQLDWDPLDVDIVFVILAITLLAISQTLERAWAAEEENKHFL